MNKIGFVFCFYLFSFNPIFIKAQNSSLSPTALPFLQIAPDARSGGMGEIGVATKPDLFSGYWNPSKIAFLKGDYGIGLAYLPWLSSVQSGISTSTLTGFRTIDKVSTLGFYFSYFSIGNVNLTDEVGNVLATYTPNEFSLGFIYSRLLTPNLSLGITAKYLYSNLSTPLNTMSGSMASSTDFATDIGLYYSQSQSKLISFDYGISISNLGPKLPGPFNTAGLYLPMTLRVGAASTIKGIQNSTHISLELSKYLVPTLPSNLAFSSTGISPYDYDTKSIPSAIFSSFYNSSKGFSGELKEIILGAGIEYSFNNSVFLRAGYHYENPFLSQKRYVTTGFGFNFGTIKCDFSYLIPISNFSLYKNTFHLSLSFSI